MEPNSIDIEKMFAEAVKASEDTGEKAPEIYGDGYRETAKQADTEVLEQDTPKKRTPELKPPSPSFEQSPEPVPRATPTIPKQEPLVKQPVPRADFLPNKKITVESITKIIEMKQLLDKYNPTEKEFVTGYFQSEKDDVAQVIYSALTANQRDLDALNKIVVAKKHTAADRAFYLMDLDNNSIEAVYEQVSLIVGEVGETERVRDNNKIKVCRTLERAISEMPDDVFLYIKRLQDFTNKALAQ